MPSGARQINNTYIHTMTLHDDFLNTIGMITNVEKTELIYFSRKKQDYKPLTVKNQVIKPSKSIKVLGITFEQDLTWDKHIRGIINRSRLILRKLKYLRKVLNKADLLKVATAHLYGLLYYAAPVWLNMQTSARHLKLLNSLHFRAMRIVLGDFRNKLSRNEVTNQCKRATPSQWSNYCNAKMAITLTNLGKMGPRISDQLTTKCYINDRRPGRGTFPDTSRLKIGRNAFTNRLEMMKKINFDWTMGINPHQLRQKLKSVFLC